MSEKEQQSSLEGFVTISSHMPLVNTIFRGLEPICKWRRCWLNKILQCLSPRKTWARKFLKYYLTQTIGTRYPYPSFLVGQGQHHLPHLISSFCAQFHSLIAQKRMGVYVRIKRAYLRHGYRKRIRKKEKECNIVAAKAHPQPDIMNPQEKETRKVEANFIAIGGMNTNLVNIVNAYIRSFL